MAKFSPSLKAYSLDITLVVYPIDLKNPLTQFPWLSLIIPSPPALPGFPRDAPLVLSLCHPTKGLVHVIVITIFEDICLAFLTYKK